jgi:cysteine-rich repeat protein
MKASVFSGFLVAVLLGALAPQAAYASFHLMQIEQVIGGVNGDTSAQAVQLRMRSSFQNQVQLSKLWVSDASGANPVLLIDFGSTVPNHGSGVRILATSANFAKYTDVPLNTDFVLTNVIPPSYLAAGTITFENNTGTAVYWRLSWGGASYTGPTTGSITNDADGQFGPPFGGPLPSGGLQGLLFQGAGADSSTNNADDYAVTCGAAVVTNNAGTSFTVASPADSDGDGDIDLDDLDALSGCLGGPDVAPSPPPPMTSQECLGAFDADLDSDVDLVNFGDFQGAFTGMLCGNGALDANEECDDGNNTDGDGCSALCHSEPLADCNIDFESTCPDLAPQCGADFTGGSSCQVIGVLNCYSSGLFSFAVDPLAPLTITLNGDLNSLSVFLSGYLGSSGTMTFFDCNGAQVDSPLSSLGDCSVAMPAIQNVTFSRPVQLIEVTATGNTVWIDDFHVNPP